MCVVHIDYIVINIRYNNSGLDMTFLAPRPICITILVSELGGLKTHNGMVKCDWLILEGQNVIMSVWHLID